MPSKTKNLLTKDNNSVVSKVSAELLDRSTVEAEDCPWVQVGKLYLSLTITGEESWLPLIRLLRDQGQKNFVVFTGRHGDIPNLVKKSTQETLGVFDPKHKKEDEALRERALDQMKDISIQLVDTSANKKNQTAWLRATSLEYLKQGRAVIYAWCYSIFTMFEADAEASKQEIEKKQEDEISKTVAALVDRWFQWALRP